jgi:serine/threonine-protein kinase
MNEQLSSGTAGTRRADDTPTSFGRYRILRTLAFGGMAQILLAEENRSGRKVVLKRILPHYAQNAEFVKFFIHEGRLGQRLSHANVVETIEAGEHDGQSYIALEYLKGRTAIDVLRTAARQKIEVPLGVAVRIVADAARGLHHAHNATDADGRPLDVVHRDVTPHNLFVCSDGITKVLDFGIAKAASQLHHTRTGTIKGKFAYLAPEQVKGEGIDHRVDVFALGIVLHELLTLRPLFRGANDGETLQRVLSMEVPAPERVRPVVPAGLGAVALRALQRDRERRLPSAEALADSIEAVALAEGIDATPDAVVALLDQLFPDLHHEDEEEVEAIELRNVKTVVPPETPPRGVEAIESVPLDIRDLPTAPQKAGAPTHGYTRERVQRRTGRVALLVAGAAALLGLALHFNSCMERSARAPQARALPATPIAPATPRGATPEPEAAPEAVPTLPPVIVAAPEEATLRVQTDGPASFAVDGRAMRPGSDGALHLKPGRHTVVVTSPLLAAPRTLAIDLKPKEAALRAVHSGRGQLRVAVTPWAEVLVDGKLLGTTPLEAVDLPEGPHAVTLKNGDLGVTSKRRVVVAPGKETLLKVDLFAERK